MYKVLVLIIEEFGGSSVFLKRFSGKTFKITTGPCCCCCLCLPRVVMSRYLHVFIQIHSGCYCSGYNNWILCSFLLINWDFYGNLILLLFIFMLFIYRLHIVLWLCTFLMWIFLWMGSFRRLLFFLKLGSLQYAILKTVLSVLAIVLWTNGNFDLSDVSVWNAFLYIWLYWE